VIDVSDGGGEPPPPPPPGDDTTAPSAAFAYSCGNSASCSFTDQSSDNVGVTAWSWSGAFTSSQRNPSHTFGSAGSHTVTLVATDAAGNSSAPVSRTINCQVKGRLRCS
jgi:PKD repeat protein